MEQTEQDSTPKRSLDRSSASRFQHIKEMIELPEENVSATTEPREAQDNGLPKMLLLIMGIVAFFIIVNALIFFGIGNTFVNIILGNHFAK